MARPKSWVVYFGYITAAVLTLIGMAYGQFTVLLGHVELRFFILPVLVGLVGGWLLARSHIKRILIDAELKELEATRTIDKRMRAALEGAHAVIWDWDIKAGIIHRSGHFPDILDAGGDEGSVTVDWWNERIHPEDRDQHYKAMNEHLRGRARYYESEYRARDDNGNYKWISERGVASFGDDGMAYRVAGASSAITEQRRLETLLREAVESLSEGFALFDQDDRLLLFNGKYAEYYSGGRLSLHVGQSFEDLVGKALKMGFHHVPEGGEEKWLAERVRIHKNPTGPVEQRGLGGRWYRIMETKTASGYISGLRIDVTAEKKAARDAEEANRAKSEFLANMSHELRTPLNAINGYAQLIESEPFGPLGNSRYAEYTSHIRESGDHLLSIINDILDLTRIEAGKMTVENDDVSLGVELASCLRFLEPRMNDKKFVIQCPPQENWPRLRADSRLVRQMLLNLLSNAMKFSPPGSRIEVSGEKQSDGRFGVVIEDQGIGMSADELVIAEQRFGQVESILSRENEGTGLGLPLVMSLIDLHGGDIDIRSEKGVGTKISLLFSADRVKNP